MSHLRPPLFMAPPVLVALVLHSALPPVVIASSARFVEPGPRSEDFWQRAAELAGLSERQRLAFIEQGRNSRWLDALRRHLHLRMAELEPLLALSEAPWRVVSAMAHRWSQLPPSVWIAWSR